MKKTNSRTGKKIFLETAVACLLFFYFAFSPLFAQSFNPSGSLPIKNKVFGSNGLNNSNNGGKSTTNVPTDLNSLATSSGGMTTSMEYQVHVLGQVKNAGTYRVGPSVRVAEVIGMAGGFTELGSKRRIELRQSNGGRNIVDLFEFLKRGNLSQNPFVQDNDVVFVPFVQNNIRIEGPVKDPGDYELVREKTVWDVIQLAGGYTSGSSQKGELVIVRFDGTEKKQLLKQSNIPTELEKVVVQSGDIIVVPHLFTNGRTFDYGVDELPGDKVFYPSYNNNVFVVGAVTQAGPYPYNPNLSLRDYVNLAGPSPLAKMRKTRVLKADGKMLRKPKKYMLNPGDTIIVPEKKMTASNALSWYSTFASTVFTGVALKTLVDSY